MSFWAATDTNSANSVSQSLFTGGGQMQIASSSGGNTGGDIVVRSTNGTAGAHNCILDLSGLSSFNANVDQLLVAYSNTGGSQDRPNAVMYLAVNNTLTLNNTGTIASAATANGSLILGFAGNHSSGQASTLYLGTTNTINMANAVLGGRRETVSMLFNPNMLSGGTQFTTTPTVTMRGIDGVSRVTFISLGDATGNVSGSTNMSSGTLDLSGGIADIKVTTLQMGTSTASSSSSSQGGSGVLTFTAGTVDATNVLLGNMVASLNTGRGGDTGTINANGTANLVVGTGGIILGSRNFTGQGTSTGTLNIRNSATVTINGNLAAGGYIVSATDGSYGNIMMRDSSTLDMQGHAIGAGGPINNFTVSGGSIVNTTAITAITFQVNGSSNSNYTLTTPLTIYNGGAINLQNGYNNTFTVSNLTLPTLSTSSLNFDLSNSTASGNDQISVGTLNLGSGSTTTVKVNPLSSTFATGTYHLLNYTSMSGSTTWNVSNPTRNTMSAPSINTTTKNLDLVVGYVPAHNLTWAGGTGSTSTSVVWDWNTTANWTSPVPPPSGTATPDTYYDLDNVTFVSDPGLQPSYIKLTNLFPGAVAANQGFTPGSVTVNSNTDYTFTANTAGSDKISGTTGLSKSGTGTLTISLSNTYSGTTNLTGGTIVLANSAALGTGSMTINGGTLDLHNNSLGSKAITVQGAGVGGLGAIVNNSTSAHTAYQNDISNITLSGDTTFGGVGVADTVYNAGLPANTVGRWDFYNAGGSNTLIGNSHTLTKTGATTILMVDMTADSTTTDFVINEGILGLERGTSMGSSAGTITVNGAGGQPTTRLDNSQPGGGSILQMNNLTIPLNKHVSLSNNGQIYVMQNDADSTGGDIISGPIAVADSGGVLNAGGVRADLPRTPTRECSSRAR